MYVKLFDKILDSSIWLEPDPVRIAWITMLAAMDEDGFCGFASAKNLARRANIAWKMHSGQWTLLKLPTQIHPTRSLKADELSAFLGAGLCLTLRNIKR